MPSFHRRRRASRSSRLRIGAYLIIRNIIEDYSLDQMIVRLFGKEGGLLLDLASYSIICENNAAQYYPDYAFNHPLFTEVMRIYSDAKVSSFLHSITEEHTSSFLNGWNYKRNHRQRIYISYDSTNKNCQAGDISIVEFGHAKEDKGFPIFNYAIAYDQSNREPLFYEEYPGSFVDVSQLQFMLEKAKAYGYRNVSFILDRGYFSKGNIEYMDDCGYDFVIMVKGMASLVSGLITEHLREQPGMLDQVPQGLRQDRARTGYMSRMLPTGTSISTTAVRKTTPKRRKLKPILTAWQNCLLPVR